MIASEEKPVLKTVTVPVIIIENTRHFLSYFSDRFFGHPSQELHITGITGTNGKTTTAHFLYEIYQAASRKSALMGTVGVKTTKQYRKQSLTTPDAEELHKTLWQLKQEGVRHVAMEVSSHALVQKRVEHCFFHAAIFTNLSREHLDYHQNMHFYFQAKAHLLDLLKLSNGKAIINADDQHFRQLQQLTDSCVTYGIKNKADVRAENIQKLPHGGSTVTINSPWGKFYLTVNLAGLYNVYNALAAAAAALADQISIPEIITGIDALKMVPGRLELLPSPPGVKVYLDYAHTPDGLEKLLQTISEYPHQKIILIFGCRGNRDRGKRPLMGLVAEKYADTIILTADNPAYEDPAVIACDIAAYMRKKPFYFAERQEAIHFALAIAKPGDIVLITGKGRESYQLIGSVALPYSDLQVVNSYVQSHYH